MKDRSHKGAMCVLAVLLSCLATRAQDLQQRVQTLDREARAAEKAGHPEIAIERYRELVKLNPKLAAAYNNLGRLLYEQGQFVQAMQALKRASELDPNLEAPHAQLGLCLFQLNRFQGARQEFQSALKLDPKDGIAKLFLARSLINLEQYVEAVRLLEQLQRSDPQNPEVLFSLGWGYSILAVSTLDAIQKADPDSYLVDLLKGKYAEVKEVYPEAAEHYKDAIAKAPNQPELHYCYAHTLFASGDSQMALREYRRVLEMNPSDYRANWEAARILLPEDPKEAFRLASHALEVQPRIAEARSIRGRALLALGKPSEAVEDFKAAAALDPSNAAHHFQLARAYGQLGLAEQARAETAIYERIQRDAHRPITEEGPGKAQ